jgi:hypothetical protein
VTTTESSLRRSASALGRIDEWARTPAGTVASVVAVVLLAWPSLLVPVGSGVDPGWLVALRLAWIQKLEWGRDVVYTHGPFGFLNQPFVIDDRLAILSIVAGFLAYIVLATATVLVLRRGIPPLAAAVVAVVVLTVTVIGQATQMLELAVVLWACVVVTSPRSRRRSLEAGALGVLAGGAVLVKTDAVVLAVIALYAVVGAAWSSTGGRDALRDGAAFAGGFVAASLVGWLVAGQSLGALGSWLHASLEEIRGHNAGMGIEPTRGRPWWFEYLLAAPFAGLCLWWSARAQALDRRRRAVLTGLVAIVLYTAFKYGFVRHDGHVVKYFIAVAFLAVALIPVWGRRRALGLLLAAVLVLSFVVTGDRWRRFDPGRRIDDMAEVARLTLSSGHRTESIDDARMMLRGAYALTPSMLERMGGQTVHIAPYETAVAFAYPELRWQPLPNLQAYTASTPYLDDRDAEVLAGPDRPRFVLRHVDGSIDGRLVRFESPRATLELLCHYGLVEASGRWQLLEADGNRCGVPRRVRTRSVELGTPIPVPRVDDALVVARVHGLGTGATEAARGLVWKPRELSVGIDGERYRYIGANQGQPHVLSAPECAPAPDAQAPRQVDQIVFRDRLAIPGLDAGATGFRVEFSAVPYACGDRP